MSTRSFLEAIPKVELNVRLEGSLPFDTVQLIAEQNDIPRTFKQYKQWMKQYQHPDYTQLQALIRVVSQWIQQPEDLTKLVYEVGVGFAKQHIQYAEVTINPLLFVGSNRLTFEQFLNAINDGRTRVERAWHVRMAWILGVTPDDSQHADDVLRWASSPPAVKGGVVGLAFMNSPGNQSISEFERIFRTAEKKELGRIIYLRSGDQISSVLEQFNPDRVVIGSGADLRPEDIRLLTDRRVAVDACVTRDIRLGREAAARDLRRLYDDGVHLSLSSEMPCLYASTLTDELAMATEGFSIAEIEEIMLNAVRSSLLPDDSKQSLLDKLQNSYRQLETEHQIVHETA